MPISFGDGSIRGYLPAAANASVCRFIGPALQRDKRAEDAANEVLGIDQNVDVLAGVTVLAHP
jgi:hypothetical protein